jgi:hypothetical protein
MWGSSHIPDIIIICTLVLLFLRWGRVRLSRRLKKEIDAAAIVVATFSVVGEELIPILLIASARSTSFLPL